MGIKDTLRLIKRRLLFDPRKIDRIEGKLDSLSALVKATHDITKAPAAAGIRRMSQLANAVLLKRVTDVLDRNGIPYWLIAGTLLGAVRHGGSVPWDDDIDIAVLRKDHNRLVDLLKKAFEDVPDFVVVKSDAMRVMLTDSSCQVDIFSADEYHVSSAEVDRLKKSYRECQLAIKRDYSKLKTRESTIVNMSDDDVQALQKRLAAQFSGDLRVLMLGIETGCNIPLMWHWDWIFPLKKMAYEGIEFSVPNKPELVLLDHYGDYMAFPGEMHAHSDIEARLTLDAYVAFDKMLKSAGLRIGAAGGLS